MTRGRPREFDTERALESAMMTFWEKGYQATSLDELTAAMGITRPSLYAAFGDKEQLFLKAIEFYQQRFSKQIGSALSEDIDTKSAIALMFQRILEIHLDPTLPSGCFIVNSTLECCTWSDFLQRKFAEHYELSESSIYNRLRQGQLKGEVALNVDIRSLAQFYSAVSQGIAVLAKAQNDPIVIRNIAEVAMQSWPSEPVVLQQNPSDLGSSIKG